ncbi:hypothetical protein ACH5RR_036404 [Cinchona calisaya]|uniref:Uncharacterized protein n=1 Tax=Cinchona calisaya TaxID=153742 RepID=A0ABD2Y811_9GENT
MTSAIQSSMAVLKEDNAKESARRDVESKLVMEKLEEGEQVKKHKKEWSGMNFMLNENTEVVYNLAKLSMKGAKEVPKASIQGAPFGTNEEPSNYTVGGRSNGESTAKGPNNVGNSEVESRVLKIWAAKDQQSGFVAFHLYGISSCEIHRHD